MVRRWSYINNSISRSSLSNVLDSHRFKVFRKNTKFKRFNRGVIDFVRRKNIKRKRSFNYIQLSYVSSDWSKNYLNSRSIHRFTQGVRCFEFAYQSVAYDLVFKLAKKTNHTSGFQTLSAPKKRAYNLTKNFSNFSLQNSLCSYSRNTIYNTCEPFTLSDSHSKLGISGSLDLPSRFPVVTKDKNLYNLLTITSLSSKPLTSLVVSARQIISLTCIYNVSKN
jgi:hypothetical protein